MNILKVKASYKGPIYRGYEHSNSGDFEETIEMI